MLLKFPCQMSHRQFLLLQSSGLPRLRTAATTLPQPWLSGSARRPAQAGSDPAKSVPSLGPAPRDAPGRAPAGPGPSRLGTGQARADPMSGLSQNRGDATSGSGGLQHIATRANGSPGIACFVLTPWSLCQGRVRCCWGGCCSDRQCAARWGLVTPPPPRGLWAALAQAFLKPF
jgi:hypothetical protein